MTEASAAVEGAQGSSVEPATPPAAAASDAPAAASAGDTAELVSELPPVALRTDLIAKEGDFVILWGSYTQIFGIVLQPGTITNNKFGSFHHTDLIGEAYGSKVRSRKGERQWMAMLRPTPELLTQSLVKRTQVIYHADIALLLAVLDARPGQVVVEAGSGSGSVSASLARALRPGGRLHTFEFNEERQKAVAECYCKWGIDDIVVSRQGDVCGVGFGDELGPDSVDAVFLDLPEPWEAIKHVDKILVGGGRICTFSPCIEQIDSTAAELRRRRYHDIRMVETLAVNWGVTDANERKKHAPEPSRKKPRRDAGAPAASGGEAGAAPPPSAPAWVSYQMPMRGHTGYLLFASRPPHDEP